MEISAHQDNDDEKKMEIKISEEKHQLPLGISDEDLHYKRTISTVLNYSADRSGKNDKNIRHRQPNIVTSEPGSSFLRWKQCEQQVSGFVQKKKSQNVLRKILHDVPLMHTKRMFPSQNSGLNQDDPSDRRKENEKFSVLRTMVPTVNEVITLFLNP